MAKGMAMVPPVPPADLRLLHLLMLFALLSFQDSTGLVLKTVIDSFELSQLS